MSWKKLDQRLHTEPYAAKSVTVKVFVQVGDDGDMIHLSTANGHTRGELLTTLRGAFIECARAVARHQQI